MLDRYWFTKPPLHERNDVAPPYRHLIDGSPQGLCRHTCRAQRIKLTCSGLGSNSEDQVVIDAKHALALPQVDLEKALPGDYRAGFTICERSVSDNKYRASAKHSRQKIDQRWNHRNEGHQNVCEAMGSNAARHAPHSENAEQERRRPRLSSMKADIYGSVPS
jgi:hypothetical protein